MSVSEFDNCQGGVKKLTTSVGIEKILSEKTPHINFTFGIMSVFSNTMHTRVYYTIKYDVGNRNSARCHV